MLLKSLSWNTLGNCVYFFSLWLISVFVVWLSEDFENPGNLALAMTVTNVFVCVALYNVRPFQVSDTKNEFTDTHYIGARLTSCLASVLFTVAFVLIVGYTARQVVIIVTYMVFRSVEALIDVFHGISQKKWRMDLVGISLAARGLLMLAAFTVLLYVRDFTAAIFGMLVSAVAVGVFYDFRKTKFSNGFFCTTKICHKQTFALLVKCFPLMIVMLVNVLIMSYPRYVLERVMGTEALGIYATVAAPAQVVNLAGLIVLTPLTNIFAQHVEKGEGEKFRKLTYLCGAAILTGTTVAAIASMFIGRWGLALIFGEGVSEYAYVLPGIVFSVGLLVMLLLLNIAYTAIRDIKNLTIGNLIGVLFCFGFSGFFVERFGLLGVNYVLIISMAVSILFLFARFFFGSAKFIKTQ